MICVKSKLLMGTTHPLMNDFGTFFALSTGEFLVSQHKMKIVVKLVHYMILALIVSSLTV